jgi:hypothetical protein
VSLRTTMTTLAGISATWCIVTGVRIWVTPVRWAGVVGGAPPGETMVEYRSFSEISLLGPVPLVIPAALAIFAAWAAWRGRGFALAIAALLFAGYGYITGFSIGGAYRAPAGLLIAATILALLPGQRKGQAPPTD